MTEATLKPGWRKWRFDQIATNVNERIDDPSESDFEYYVGLEHIDPDSLKLRRWGSPSDVEATKLIFRKGDIIFGRRRVYQRKVAVAEFDGICSAHALVLRPNPEVIIPEFLPFFMQSDLFMERAKSISVGSLSPTINWRTLAKQEFCLPSLVEQKSITKLMNSMSTVYAETESAIETSKKLLKSYVNSIDQSFEHEAIRDNAAFVTSGSRGWASYYADEGAWFIRVTNLTRDSILLDLEDLKHVQIPPGQEGTRTRVSPGDLLVAITGIYLGMIAVVPEGIPEAYVNQHLALVRLNPEKFNSYFVAHMLTGVNAQREVWRKNDGGTRPGMTLSEVKSLPVPKMNLDEQNERANHLREISEKLQSCMRHQQHIREMQKRFRDSLLTG